MPDALTRQWESLSLRAKVTGASVFILALGILIAGVGTTWLLRDYLVQRVDEQLRAAIEDPENLLPELNPTEPPRGYQDPNSYYWAFLGPDGSMRNNNWVSPNLDEALRPETGELTLERAREIGTGVVALSTSAGGPGWRAIVRDSTTVPSAGDGVLVIALPMTRTEATMTRYTTLFFGFGILVIVIAAALTQVLVTRAFLPLRDVERTAAAIAAGDFSLRLRNESPGTEVGRLNRALNTMLGRIDRAFADRARTLDQMRRFIGDASHELRTPLVTVRGYAELYRIGALKTEEDIAQAMERIEKEAVRMGLLVEDLLALARLDEARPIQREPVDLLPLVRDAARDAMAQSPDRVVTVIEPDPELDLDKTQPIQRLDEPATAMMPAISDEAARRDASRKAEAKRQARALAAKNETRTESKSAAAEQRRAMTATGPIALAGATLAKLRRLGRKTADEAEAASPAAGELPPLSPAAVIPEPTHALQPIVVLGEENKLRQVLANLITNALRFTPAGSPLELRIDADRGLGLAHVEVIDHGEGIPPQIREQIFQRFWRADNSRTRETGGSGLGLAIVAAIVQAHHGRVEVLETPGGGATFRVTLPLMERA